MTDQEIVALYWQRDEGAIGETQQKYGGYLTRIAWQVLGDRRDSEESVNDTYLKAWNAMPPSRPALLASFLARITRQLSIDRFRTKNRQKRGGGEYAASLDELADCVSGDETPQSEAELRLLGQAVSRYLAGLPRRTRAVFISRYFYLDPLREIAAQTGSTEQAVKSLLHRTRAGLREHLEKEGFAV